MKRLALVNAPILVFCCLTVTSAYAGPVMPVSYDMLNGGSDSGLHYWDGIYPDADSTTDYGELTGGLGDLTDGIVASDNYYIVENPVGTGPYVGWDARVIGAGPTITFNFAATVAIDTVRIHSDNANSGRVSLPDSVDISMGGAVQSFSIPFDSANLEPRWLEFTGLDLSGSSLNLTLHDRSMAYDWPGYTAGWVFISEVAFASVPEPTTLLLLGLGLAGLGFARKRLH